MAVAFIGLGVFVWLIAWPAEQLSAAEQALRQHDLPDARGRLQRYLARWPDDRKALLLAARAAWQSGDYADGERFVAESERAAGPTETSRLEWALLGAHQGDFSDNEAWLRSIADGNQAEAAAVLEALARGYHLACRWEDSHRALNKLIERDPTFAAPLVQRGAIRRHLGGPHEAEGTEEDFRHAVAVAPDNVPAHLALAGALSDQGRSQEAMSEYESVLRLQPAVPAALLALARLCEDAAQIAEAERRLDELLAAQPENPEALVERGRLALRRGQLGEAEKFLARAVRAAPWHREAHRLYLVALKERGQSSAATQCEARVAELKAEDADGARLKLRLQNAPDDLNLQWQLYRWCERNGEHQDGFACLLDILRLDPRHGPANAALAEHFEGLGQPRRASQHRALAGEAKKAG